MAHRTGQEPVSSSARRELVRRHPRPGPRMVGRRRRSTKPGRPRRLRADPRRGADGCPSSACPADLPCGPDGHEDGGYPRTALVLPGHSGLERRKKWSRRLNDLQNEPNAVQWTATFARRRDAMQRARAPALTHRTVHVRRRPSVSAAPVGSEPGLMAGSACQFRRATNTT